MSASVVTYKGREIYAAALNGTVDVPKYVGWGIDLAGVDTLTAAQTDVSLFSPSLAQTNDRATGTTSIVTTNTTNDTLQVVGTLTAASSLAICEVGLFDSATYPATDSVQASSGVIGSATGTTVIVATGGNFTVGNFIQIRTEVMKVTAISTNTLTVTRAQNGTTAISTIAQGDVVGQGNPPGQTGVTGGNLFGHADFAVINLSSGDSIQFTLSSYVQ